MFTRIGVFFSKMAVVTFGGAYAVLAYVAQQAVETGWLEPGEMLDGLGLAETTAALIVQFVASWRLRSGNASSPCRRDARRAAHHLGHLRALFSLDLLGAPFVEALRGNRPLGGALAAGHRRSGRRHPQPRHLVCAARAVRRDRGCARAGLSIDVPAPAS